MSTQPTTKGRRSPLHKTTKGLGHPGVSQEASELVESSESVEISRKDRTASALQRRYEGRIGRARKALEVSRAASKRAVKGDTNGATSSSAATSAGANAAAYTR